MKIAVIGGGSYLWSLGFCNQFIHSRPLAGAQVCLMDLDGPALDLVHRAAEIVNAAQGNPVRIEKTGEMDRALDGADFVIVSISTGGLDAMRYDLEIPEKYGIWHTVGDTVGPGGWSRAVRNIPVFHRIGERMKALCPEAWLINVSNPLTPLTRTPERCFGIKAVGMCPGVHEQSKCLALLAGCAEVAEPDYVVTGIDHGSWFTSLTAGECDVLAKLKELGYCRSDGVLPSEVQTQDPLAEQAHTRAAFAVWREIGYLPSIGDRHIVENFPWFVSQPTPDLPFRLKRTSVADRREWKESKRKEFEEVARTSDIASLKGFGHGDDPIVSVIESLRGFRSFLYGSNYRNIGQIPGLPEGAVVETRVRFDRAGIHPLASPMPDILKCLTLPTVLRQEAVIDITLHGSFDELVALVLTDPLCSRMPIRRCREMMRELLTANRELIRNPRLLEF